VLSEIRIRDLGVIDDAVLELHPALTVLTGETGAGKTMVVSGLLLLLGVRADPSLVRVGADRAVVEGVLDLPAGHPALLRAAEAGADIDDGLILVRTVSGEGRSRAHVGGRAAPAGLLTELSEHLVAVHGQADQWRLRHADQHRELLDAFGGPPLGDALTTYRAAHAEHARVGEELARLRSLGRERAQQIEVLRLGLERIEQVDPLPGEDAALRVEDERLAHAEELRLAAHCAGLLVVGDDDAAGGSADGVTGALASARAAVAGAAANDPELAELEVRLVELGILASDLGSDLTRYADTVDLDPQRLGWVQQRRAQLGTLTARYGHTVDEVLAWSARAVARLTELLGADDRLGELEADLVRLTEEREQAAARVSAERERAAASLGERITGELAGLGMPRAAVSVVLTPSGVFGPQGADDVEIRLAANPGTPARTVTKAASGGELSRVMLAIEVATAAEVSQVPTFVFDEVDAGVGGRAALDVGSRLAELSRHAQVVVVTHLAQVAAHADRHLVVTKSGDGHITTSGVVAVEGEERVAELARMMAGAGTDAALENARELLARAGRAPSGAAGQA
jgi:DNA repair protein RecN (Recombination protein N)